MPKEGETKKYLNEQEIGALCAVYDSAVAETNDHEPDLNIVIQAKPGQKIKVKETKSK